MSHKALTASHAAEFTAKNMDPKDPFQIAKLICLSALFMLCFSIAIFAGSYCVFVLLQQGGVILQTSIPLTSLSHPVWENLMAKTSLLLGAFACAQMIFGLGGMMVFYLKSKKPRRSHYVYLV